MALSPIRDLIVGEGPFGTELQGEGVSGSHDEYCLEDHWVAFRVAGEPMIYAGTELLGHLYYKFKRNR
jgi:hypothetical protein